MASEFNIKNGFISNNNSIVQGTLTATTIVATTYLNLPYSGSASGTTNYLSKFTGTNSIGDSIVYDNGTNVGIGKTNPSVKLDVIGDIRASSFFYGTTAQVNNIQTNGQNLSIKGVGSTLVTIDQISGYVGIGTTSPSTTLQVSSATNQGVVIGTSVYPNWMGTNGLYVDGSFRANNYLLNSGGAINWGASQTKITGYNPSSGSDTYLSFFTGGISANGERIRIIDNGNVGIGTTSPTSKLDILDTTLAGSGDLSGSALNIAQTWNTTGTPTAIKLNVTNTASTGSTKLLDLQVGSVTKSSIDANGTGVFFGLNVSTGGIYTTNIYDSGSATNSKITMGGSSKYIAFNTNNTEAARISSNQNLLLGTTSDNGSKLNVQGSVTASSAIARGQYLAPTLVAAANDDVLVGLDIASTFTLGAFTNVGQYHLRIASPPTNGYSIFLGGNATINGSNQMNLFRNGAAVFGSSSLETNVSTAAPNVPLKFTLSSGALEFGRFAATTGNLLLGTTSDGGAKLQISGSINPTSTVARGVSISPTLVATANNDTLIGLDINPTFSGGSFTGVTNYAMRVYGGIRISNGTQIGIIGQPSSYNIYVSSTETAINSTSILSFQVNGSTYGRMFNTGNLVLQNGGTFTDIPSARLQINSTTQGVLLPRMTTAQINGIVSPVQGLTVFNTDLNTLCFYTTSWQKVTNTAM